MVYGFRRPILQNPIFMKVLDGGFELWVLRFFVIIVSIVDASTFLVAWLVPIRENASYEQTILIYSFKILSPIMLYIFLFYGPRMKTLLILLFILFFINKPLIQETVSLLNNGRNADLLVPAFFLLIYTIPALVVPTLPLTRRLTFLLIGVALIFGLSEVSKQVEKLRTAPRTIETQ